MSRSPLRFRCFQCNKMLGVSPSKAGRVVSCPSCRAELIVPEPEVESCASVEEEIVDLGITLETQLAPQEDAPTTILSEPTLSRPIFREEPLTSIERDTLPATEADFDGLGISIPELQPALANVPPPLILEREGRTRSRDVILPRGVVAAWSLLVLLAVFAAFGAGLLVGHFVWKDSGPGAAPTQPKR